MVHALAKGLEILSAFSEGELLGNQQLVDATGLPKATVSRLTSTLVHLGYLRVDPHSRKLTMGTRVMGLGVSVQRKLGLQRCARPFMEALSKEYDLTVSMGTQDRLSVVVLEVCWPPNFSQLVVNFDAGIHLPLSKTSLGLACIVETPIKERARILDGLRKSLGTEWNNVRARIERAHREYEQYGFIVSQGSLGRDVCGVGVAMIPLGANAPYAFNFAGSSDQMPLSFMRKELGPRLQKMVQDIQAAMTRAKYPTLAIDK